MKTIMGFIGIFAYIALSFFVFLAFSMWQLELNEPQFYAALYASFITILACALQCVDCVAFMFKSDTIGRDISEDL